MNLLDGKYGPPMPRGLTVMPEKEALYATDAYFWEGWEDLVEVAQESALAVLQTHSFILVRPDAIVSRKIEPILEWLRLNDYSVVGAAALQTDRHQVRSLWQFQWNAALPERKAACDILMGAGPSLMLLIRTASGEDEVATHRFAKQKGPADPKVSQQGGLRASLGHKSIMLSLIHSPDEPADLIREIGILLPEKTRKSFLRRMLSNATLGAGELSRLVGELYACAPKHELEFAQSLLRVEAAAKRHMDAQSQASREAVKLIEDMQRHVWADWRDLFDLLDESGTPYDEWDCITVAGHVIAMNHDNVKLLISRPSKETAQLLTVI
nr:nucleoside-diphosphate kinase [uncultured Rhodoferax sp.]